MALWTIHAPTERSHRLRALEPSEVLAHFDVPLTFTVRGDTGDLWFAHLAAVGKGIRRYLLTSTNEDDVSDLKRGLLSLRQILTEATSLWVVDVNAQGVITESWIAGKATSHEDAIPAEGVLLTAELEESQSADPSLARFAKSRQAGQFSFAGVPVKDHSIDADFYGQFWTRIAEMFRAMLPADLLNVPKLRLGITFPSSYGVQLQIDAGDEELSLYSRDRDVRSFRREFEQLVSLIVDADRSPESVLLIKLNPRIRRSYGDILDLLSSRSASVTARTRNFPSARRIDAEDAARQLLAVRKLGWPFNFINVTGKMVGGYVEKMKGVGDSQFGIRVENEGEATVEFRGTVAPEGVPQMAKVKFTDTVRARLMIEEKGDEQIYRLIDVHPVEPDTRHGVE